MRLKVVVVVPHSPSNSGPCWKCAKPIDSSVPPYTCLHCGVLQDFPLEALDPFSLFGIAENLNLSEEKLRSAFYGISKKVHPDRFVTKAEPEPRYAQRWSTAANKAYQLLKDRTERSFYLVEKYAKGPAPKPQVPTELAESYFEMQDILSEGNRAPMVDFHQALLQQLANLEKDWQQLAEKWDKEPEHTESVLKLRKQLDLEKFLKSMLRDIERKLAS